MTVYCIAKHYAVTFRADMVEQMTEGQIRHPSRPEQMIKSRKMIILIVDWIMRDWWTVTEKM